MLQVHDGDHINYYNDLRFDMVVAAMDPAARMDAVPCPAAHPVDPAASVRINRGPYLVAASPRGITIRWTTSHVLRGHLRIAATDAAGAVLPSAALHRDWVGSGNDTWQWDKKAYRR